MCIDARYFFLACGSSAPVSVDCEGGVAARLAGTLMVPSVQARWLPLLQELWPYQSFFEPLVPSDQKASLTSLSLYLRPFRHLEVSLAWGPSLLFGTSGTWRGPPSLRSYSLDLHFRHIKGPLGGVLLCSSVQSQVFDGPASLLFSCQCWSVGRERL